MIKQFAKNLLGGVVRILPALPGGKYLFQQFLEAAMEEKLSAMHHGLRMIFCAPNELCRYRIASFSTKEPETLDWIDALPESAIVWDIGANIGIYSVYAAMKRGARVFAFEPSVFNLEILARNIDLNKLQKQITIVPIPLSERAGTSLFKMTTMAWGGALSTFEKNFGQDGKELKEVFEYSTCGISMGDAIEHLGLPWPRFIKMDVDGIEHLILRGGASVLKNVDSVLVEINDDFSEQAEQSSTYLKAAGLTLHRKCSLGAGNQYNQWWIR